MARTTKILGFSVPPSVVLEVERVSCEERRTKSELFRERFRMYESYRKQRNQGVDPWVLQLIADAKREEEEKPMSVAEMRAVNEPLLRYGQSQAKKLGIKQKDVDRIIHASRARRKA